MSTGSFVVEIGNGSPLSNTYVSTDDADAYLQNSGRKVGDWDGVGHEGKEAALVKAWFFMLARWQTRWRGFPTFEDQAGDWPQRDQFKKSGHAFASNEIPPEVVNSQIEYALIEATTPNSLFPNPEYDETNRAVVAKTDKVDVLTETRQYSDRKNPTIWRKFPLADNLIAHLVMGGAQTELLRM